MSRIATVETDRSMPASPLSMRRGLSAASTGNALGSFFPAAVIVGDGDERHLRSRSVNAASPRRTSRPGSRRRAVPQIEDDPAKHNVNALGNSPFYSLLQHQIPTRILSRTLSLHN